MHWKHAWVAPALILTVAAVQSARASTPIPPASYEITLGTVPSEGVYLSNGLDSPSTFTATIYGYSVADFSGTATTSAYPDPSVVVSLQSLAEPSRSFGGFSAASETYDFSITGPEDISVPIDLIGDISTSVSESSAGQTSVSGIIGVSVVGGSSYGGATLCGPSSGANPCAYDLLSTQNVPVDESISLPSNELDQIYLLAQIYGGQYGSIDGSVTVDPYLEIDPAWLASNPGYSLVFSSGVGDLPPAGVAEPGSWAMLLLGIGAIGAGLRVRRDASSDVVAP